MNAKSTTSMDVEIFGGVYRVRGEHDREHLLRLADLVDRRMRDIGEHVQTLDSGKIAVLAALNLADELVQCTNEQEGERDRVIERVAALTGELTEAIQT